MTVRFLLCAIIFVAPLVAQDRNVHAQPFMSNGISVSRANGMKSDILTVGVAAIVPISKKFFARPIVAAGRSFAIDPPKPVLSVPVFQAGALLGYHATKRFSPVAGFVEAMQFPKTGVNLYLPTLVISTATRVYGHWGIYTPFTVNAKSYGLAIQLGYTK
jgi:hypothetical protein